MEYKFTWREKKNERTRALRQCRHQLPVHAPGRSRAERHCSGHVVGKSSSPVSADIA